MVASYRNEERCGTEDPDPCLTDVELKIFTVLYLGPWVVLIVYEVLKAIY